MNIIKQSLSVLLVCLFSIGLLSCGAANKMTKASDTSDKEAVAALKSGLKFKTHFGLEGETDIKATNISTQNLDLSDLMLHIQQVGSDKYKAYTLQELQIANNLDVGGVMDMHLSLDERIVNDFNGSINKYNVSIVYKSKTPLKNGDDRNIYYISYRYKGK